jgi:hypothetical protein
MKHWYIDWHRVRFHTWNKYNIGQVATITGRLLEMDSELGSLHYKGKGEEAILGLLHTCSVPVSLCGGHS